MKTYSKDEVIGVAAEISTRDEFSRVESPLILRIVEEAAKSFSKTLGEPVAVPSGWQLVPIEPTEEMLEQATTHDLNKRTAETDQWNRDTWSFMLSAAPHHPTTEKGCE